MATAPDPNTNPLAWAKWAMTQDPGTYDLGRADLTDPGQVKSARNMLERAGRWNPEWNAWADFRPDYTDSGNGGYFGPDPDFSSLKDLSAQFYRGPGYMGLSELIGADGEAINNEQWQQSGSMKGSDWMQAAMMVAGPAFAAAGGAGALGNSLYGLQGAAGAAAGGATAGAVTGGLNSAASGENILKGALRGGLLGGAGGYASSALGSMFPGGDLPSGMDLAADGGLNSIDSAAFQLGGAGIDAATGLPNYAIDPPSLFQNVADPTAALQDLGGMPNMPPADFAGPSVNINSGNPFDPMPQFNAPPGNFGDPFELTTPMGGFPGTDGGGFNPSMSQFLPPAALPGMQPSVSQSQPPTPEGPPADPSFRPSQNYGDGMTGNQTGAYDAVIGATGSAGLANAAATVAGAGGAVSSLVGGLGGLGTILPIAGAIAGSQPSGGGTRTEQTRTDPRFDPYLYGDGGFLPSAKSWFDEHKSGANDTMRAGWQQQLGLLQDPQIAQQLTGMRNQGLLQSQAPIAGNPFTSGQMTLPNGGVGLLGGMQYPRMPDRRSMG